MKIERLTMDRVEDFVDYCKKHRTEIDDSFLYDEDLKAFRPNEINPTYVTLNAQGDIVGAISLIIDDYAKRGEKARFRIFHSEIEEVDVYQSLLQTILPHTSGLKKLFIFIPKENQILDKIIRALTFTVDRVALALVREAIEVPEVIIPEGYEIRPFQLNQDEGAWCKVRNAGFATLRGSETPQTPEMVNKMMASNETITGGSKILYHEDQPVGVIRGSKDELEGASIMNIGPLAILPEYQGKGLGRILLRTLLHFAQNTEYERAILSVNEDNVRAISLYIQEGFKQVEAITCYEMRL